MPAFDLPCIRPGLTASYDPEPRLVAFFPNAAMGNSTVQLLMTLGVPGDRLGIIPPDRLPRGQGLLLSIPLDDPSRDAKIEDLCRKAGAEIHRQTPQSPHE